MRVLLAIAGEKIQVNAPSAIIDLVVRRYAAFAIKQPSACSNLSPIVIEVTSRTPTFSAYFERSPKARVLARNAREVTIDGAITGRYDIFARRGLVEQAQCLGDIDTMLRLILSIALPLGGGLLMHGAALNNPLFGAIALCGESGTGKSTAAAALGAACDELLVLRPENNTVNLCATPYWRGVPLCTPCQGAVCLTRGGEPAFAFEHGGEALRHLARHVVRFVPIEETERAIFALLTFVCKYTPVLSARCPEGDAYIPYLSEKLGQPLRAAA
jgi:hypothetical protein